MPDYVVGFAFAPDRKSVALIRKNHPEWQVGKLNGIGGRVNVGEAHVEAMVREFFEEAGVNTVPDDWQLVIEMEYPGGTISFFRTFSNKAWLGIYSTTSEPVRRYALSTIGRDGYETIANVNWILPLCIHADADASGSRMKLPVRIVEEMVEGIR